MNDAFNNNRRYPSDDGSDPGNTLHPDVEQLSAYLDEPSGIDGIDREAIAGHLATCQTCSEVLADLQMMVQTLGTLPEREAPRSFALSRDMLELVKTPAPGEPVILQESAQWHARHAGKVRWATAVAAMLFVFVISADLVTNGLRGTSDSADDDVATLNQSSNGEAEESLGALSAEDPAQIPTVAVAEEAPQEESEESAPPAADEYADDMADTPESAEVPESDEAGDDDGEETAMRLEGEEEQAEEDAGDTSMYSVEEEAISDESASKNSSPETDSSQTYWRIAQVSLALILALLLAVMIGLPKQRGPRRH